MYNRYPIKIDLKLYVSFKSILKCTEAFQKYEKYCLKTKSKELCLSPHVAIGDMVGQCLARPFKAS